MTPTGKKIRTAIYADPDAQAIMIAVDTNLLVYAHRGGREVFMGEASCGAR